jgi:hypothetical protein
MRCDETSRGCAPRLSLAERLSAELQEEIRLGLLSSTVARELARLPRGTQERVAKTIRTHELTSRQTYLIVTALLGADDPRARDEVLADPLRYPFAGRKVIHLTSWPTAAAWEALALRLPPVVRFYSRPAQDVMVGIWRGYLGGLRSPLGSCDHPGGLRLPWRIAITLAGCDHNSLPATRRSARERKMGTIDCRARIALR